MSKIHRSLINRDRVYFPSCITIDIARPPDFAAHGEKTRVNREQRQIRKRARLPAYVPDSKFPNAYRERERERVCEIQY